MTQLYNKTSEKAKRQILRKNMPKAEEIIWSKLRAKQIEGCKFRRQYSVDKFVLDFYCVELKLALEIDGDSHYLEGAEEYDRERQIFIESFGIKFLRFTNNDVYENLDGVVQVIADKIQQLKQDRQQTKNLTPSP